MDGECYSLYEHGVFARYAAEQAHYIARWDGVHCRQLNYTHIDGKPRHSDVHTCIVYAWCYRSRLRSTHNTHTMHVVLINNWGETIKISSFYLQHEISFLWTVFGLWYIFSGGFSGWEKLRLVAEVGLLAMAGACPFSFSSPSPPGPAREEDSSPTRKSSSSDHSPTSPLRSPQRSGSTTSNTLPMGATGEGSEAPKKKLGLKGLCQGLAALVFPSVSTCRFMHSKKKKNTCAFVCVCVCFHSILLMKLWIINQITDSRLLQSYIQLRTAWFAFMLFLQTIFWISNK